MIKTYKGLIDKLQSNQIFVFGSNTQGRHGKGAALIALKKFGAIYGQSKGLQGNSWGICTKDLTKYIHPSISTKIIKEQIFDLYKYANNNLDKEFLIAYSGKGINLNGYTPEEMAFIFGYRIYIPDNIIFEEEFYKLIIKVNEICICQKHTLF